MQKSSTLLFIILCFVLILVSVSCTGQQLQPTLNTQELIQASQTPKPSKTPESLLTSTMTASPIPLYKVIDENTVNQLRLLHQWDIGEVLAGSTFSWFSNSKQFIIPSQRNSIFGIQSFDVEKFDTLWFTQVDFPWVATIDANDQVITYFYGLHIFNKKGEEFKTIATSENCDERLADYISVIPGTDLILTGHQDAEDEGGLNNPGVNIASLVIWDTTKKSCSALLKGFDGRLFSVSVSPDGHYISYSFGVRKPSYTWELTTKIYDLNLQKETCRVNGFKAQFDNQNQLAVYNPDNNIIFLVTPSDCKIQLKFNTASKLSVIAFSPNGVLLVGVSGNIMNIWNTTSGEKLQEIDLQESSDSLPVISFSPDGRFLLTTEAGVFQAGKIMLWGIRGN